jgi:ribosomal protein S18 acetylase RimI-like enzyme
VSERQRANHGLSSAELTVRNAAERDLEALALFEVAIAEASFGEDAVTDLGTHLAKLAKAIAREPGGLFVAVDAEDQVVGFAWYSSKTNFMTEDRYLNFRSLAVAPGPHGDRAGELLIRRGIQYAREHRLTEITGKVHVNNHGMRLLYRRTGFEPVTLTMRLRLDGEAAPA